MKKLRKGQEKLLKKAMTEEYKDEYIIYLSREDLTLKELNHAYWYFKQNADTNKTDDVVTEFDKYRLCGEYIDEIILPLYYKDVLINQWEKKDFMVEKWHKYKKKDRIFVFRTFYELAILCESKKELESKEKLLMKRINEGLSRTVYFASSLSVYIANDIYVNGENSIYCNAELESMDNIYNIAQNVNAITGKFISWDKYQNVINNKPESIDTETYAVGTINGTVDGILKNRMLYELLKNFLREICMTREDNSFFWTELDDTYDEFYATLISDEDYDALQRYKEISVKTNTSIIVSIKSERVRVNYAKGYVNISITMSSAINITHGYLRMGGNVKTLLLYMSPGMVLHKRLQNKKGSYPCRPKEILDVPGQFSRKFLEIIASCYKYDLLRDILRDTENSSLVCPVGFDDVAKYHNKADLINAKYNKSDIKRNWNKYNINNAYLICKCLSYVEKSSKNVLLNYCGISYVPPNRNVKRNIKSFLVEIISRRCYENSRNEIKAEVVSLYESLGTSYMDSEVGDEISEWINDVKGTVSDYLNMCMNSNKKISLRMKSYREIKNIHDITNRNINIDKETGEVKVPKDSVFNKLDKLLPEEFERITTRKRLIAEAKIQHHCVWIYAEKITKDISAIYSYQDVNSLYGAKKRYTIEFTFDEKKKKYCLKQVQGRYDRENTDAMDRYLRSVLPEGFC